MEFGFVLILRHMHLRHRLRLYLLRTRVQKKPGYNMHTTYDRFPRSDNDRISLEAYVVPLSC